MVDSGSMSSAPAQSDMTPPEQVTGKSPPALLYQDVGKTFRTPSGSFTAVRDINLSVAPSSFVSIVGPSGCGKSTLLNMAAGLMTPTAGAVFAAGRPVRGANADVGYVTQQNDLLPWRTVEKNVAVALEIRKVPRKERHERVRDALQAVGLEKFAAHYPSQLSGGMQKRTALARTLIYDPLTLLMDEPFAALDAQMRLSLQKDLLGLCERYNKTVVFVTHDLGEAIFMGDEVIVFGSSPGTIVHREQIPFERPRQVEDLRTDPRYNDIWERLWSVLERQIKNKPSSPMQT